MPTYQFSQNWFQEDRAETWTQFLAEYIGKPNISYLEVGVWEGRSFLWMLDNVLTHPTSRGTAVDIFPYKSLDTFQQNLAMGGHTDKVNIIAEPSESAWRKINEKFDIIYIDGGHNVRSVLIDAISAWALLKSGGIIIFDDCILQPDRFPLELQPKTATDIFVLGFGPEMKLIKYTDQLVAKKIKEQNHQAWWDSTSYFGDFSYEWYQRKLSGPNGNLFLDERSCDRIEKALKAFNKLNPDFENQSKVAIELAQELFINNQKLEINS